MHQFLSRARVQYECTATPTSWVETRELSSTVTREWRECVYAKGVGVAAGRALLYDPSSGVTL